MKLRPSHASKFLTHVTFPCPLQNAVIPPAQITAIMGASGAGKTTLLNAIAARLSGSAYATGSIYFNDIDVVPLPKKKRRSLSAYVKQEDALLPYLTVKETLRYNAELRLPTSISVAEKHKLVEDIILELNLKEVANTIVGTASSTGSSARGCSSGERRLVSIAIQLLSSPSLLLLDEPTSSLDSFTSYSLVQTLKAIANDQGRTIIMSVHQPRYSSFELFDNLILLCKGGHLVYNGPASGAKSYFENLLNIQMDREQNPADWILDLASVDYSSTRAEKESKERLEFLAAAWKERSAKEVAAAQVAINDMAGMTTVDNSNGSNAFSRFFLEVSTMTRRGYNNTLRDKGSLIGVFAETIIFAVIVGAIFWQLPNDMASVRSRQTLFVTTVSGEVFEPFKGGFWCHRLTSLLVKSKITSCRFFTFTCCLATWSSLIRKKSKASSASAHTSFHGFFATYRSSFCAQPSLAGSFTAWLDCARENSDGFLLLSV